ncbi:TIGR03826 family flagellar region protein [Alkalicoccobacillus plakortidis]|uniref:Flagellar operon protein (TIGR03826 family) n=1 Tax=Alkalicoccobacillus plakortidis TaxID=444060 RepID=A0ABT0XIH8_9BACI|nr:TIGR03826 family flagellar region protein [Alkalicoccobacillus plakortidis]MCM2675701.1 hypothetical protein [Alkalicoccobacillus plakortidis]
MGELANCSECGSLFVQTLRPLCTSCYRKQEEDYKKVSLYMRQKKNRMATLLDVCEHTEVEERRVRQFIREGRLIVTSFPNLGYPCESCGKMIQMNRICSTCKRELEEELDSLKGKQPQDKEVTDKQATQSRLNQFL